MTAMTIEVQQPQAGSAAVQATNPFPAITKPRDATLPLNVLFRGATNVRRKRNPLSIPELAALIQSQGLLMPLLVIDAGDGQWEVVAGGRRLEACELLATQGVYAVDEPIDVRIFDSRRAVEISIAENSGREGMHPADQFEAFAKLIRTEGLTIAQVASRFGVSKLTVERRMALASLEPRFIELYRQDEATLEQLQVLSLSQDHAQQSAAWDSLSSYQRSPYMLKQALLGGDVAGTSMVARFVGIETYVAAGGAVRRDLFAEQADEVWLQDGALLQRLALARLDAAAAIERAASWSWVEVHTTRNLALLGSMERDRPRARKPTDEEAETIEAWKALKADAHAKFSALEAQLDGLDDSPEAEAEALSLRLDDVESDIEAIGSTLSDLHAALAEWTPRQLQRCGVIVSIDHSGKLDVTRGLMRPLDRKAMVTELQQAGKPVPAHLQANGSIREKAAYSERLMFDMTAHRTAALQATLADSTHVALALIVERLASPNFLPHEYGGSDGPLKLHATVTHGLSNRASEFDGSPASLAFEQMRDRWGERVPGTSEALFPWLLKQDDTLLLELLAFCASSSIDALQGRDRDDYRLTDALADALDLDMADWWTPTPAKYLAGVSKAQLVDAVTEACGAEAARPIASLKKAEAIEYAAAKLDGKRWLPKPLRRRVRVDENES